ncbi:hypothetical protein AYI68_g3161 [Smittium mucronatum]|uniref:Uncharacterized protein n=1 Tax=Smittium mucronatum TaxID=133383 RepID=A0A1R0H0Q0_9FUNG|nr:hypothetical protein AYI68_g3161 [Smittium mucronatum]
MGMIKRDHELVESGAYPYGFVPEVDAWREVAENRDTGEPVMEDIVSSLLGLSLNSDPSPHGKALAYYSYRGGYRWSKGVIPALKSLLSEGERDTSNSMSNVASPLAAQQQSRSKDLYQSNWYGNSASDNPKNAFGG